MIHETILLNRIFKTNQFGRIKARVHQMEDRVVYVQSNVAVHKVGGVLTKVQKDDYECVDEEQVNLFFGISADEAGQIEECHRRSAGIDGQIYLYSPLQFAYQALQVCHWGDHMNEEQVAAAQYWVKEIYLGLMGRQPRKRPNRDKGGEVPHQAGDGSGDEDGDEADDMDEEEEKKADRAEETKEEASTGKPTEALALLAKIDRYLLLRQYLCPYAERLGFAEVFLIGMLRRGELQLVDVSKDPDTSPFKNILRLQRHVQKLYPVDLAVLELQEERNFQNVHHLTSSAQFLQAVRKRDLDAARKIALLNPWAVRASEPHDQQLTAAHIAVRSKDMEPLEILNFFETLDHFDFDLPDADGETPLFTAIAKKRLDLVKFFVDKGADLQHTSIKNKWSPVYVAATLGTVEILEYLLSLGCDVNQETAIKRTALTKACWMGREDSVRALLRHPAIDLEHKANGQRTALHMAVWGKYGGRHGKKMGSNPNDSPECAQLLLQAGADPEARDDRGKTPLIVACQTAGTRSISVLLEYGADVNALSARGATPLHTCFYFGNLQPFEALMGKGMPEGFSAPKLNASQVFPSVEGKTVTGYLPIYSPTRRDCCWVWEYLIEHEEELLALGYKELTIGPHNFDELFSLCLANSAFKCLLTLVKYYQKVSAATQARSKERQEARLGVEVDLVSLLAKALTVSKAPQRTIRQLYDLLKAETKRRGPLGQREKRILLVAYCASQAPLADPFQADSEPTVQKKARYQQHPEEGQDHGEASAEEQEESKDDDPTKVATMFDELVGNVEYMPQLAVKFCCRHGRVHSLARIVEQFPYLHCDGGAYREAGAATQEDIDCSAIFGDDEYYTAILEEIHPAHAVSPLAVAIANKHEHVVKLILEDAHYDLCSDVSPKTADTCIHAACRLCSDLQILQSLLLKVRSQLSGDKQRIEEFLARVNADGLKALDYCVFKNRHDMATVLQEFVGSSQQQVISVKWYDIEEDYPLDSHQIVESPQYHMILKQDTATQYQRSMISQFLADRKDYKFQRSLRKQVPVIEATPLTFVDSVEGLTAAVVEIQQSVYESGCNALAVDLEYHAAFERHATILCLLQMSTAEKDYIVDALVLRDNIGKSGLKDIFEDPAVVKVFHGSDSDLQLLATDLDIVTVNVFDTARAYQYLQRMPAQIAAGQLSQASASGYHNVISLRKLVKLFLEIELEKLFAVADWRIRPLPKGMEIYARCDSHFLIPIYAQIQAILAQPPYPDPVASSIAQSEESKQPLAALALLNTAASPMQALKEVSAAGTGAGGLYFSESLIQEEWFQQLRKLCHKRKPFAALEASVSSGTAQPSSTSFNGLSDLAKLTNDYVAQKLTKNNYKKVIVQFTV